MCSVGILVALIFVLVPPAIGDEGAAVKRAPTTNAYPAPVIVGLRDHQYEKAEQAARSRLSIVEADQSSSLETKRKARLEMAMVLAGCAWDVDLRSRSTRLSGNDVLLLVVITLFGGSIVLLLMKYGPQRPQLVAQTEQWMEKMQTRNRDDGFKQAGAALCSLLILGVSAGVIFLGLYFLIHLVAELNSPSRQDPKARKYFDEAKILMATAQAEDAPKTSIEDHDVLALYAGFLRKMSLDREAIEVEKRVRALEIAGSCLVPKQSR
ncbi:MAG: hypothetical protein SGJ27_01650 [Candidatus Melainabacteria bacterium]|nr:hypothetical protein [Candidatus Melainabacteria bacterium]